MQHGMLVEQEAARIRSGGAPRPVSLGGTSASVAPANAVSGAMPGAVPPPGYGAGPAYAPGYPSPMPATPRLPPIPRSPRSATRRPAMPRPRLGTRRSPATRPQQPQYNQQAAAFGSEVGNAFNAFGNALGSFVNGAGGHDLDRRAGDGPVDRRQALPPATVMMMQGGQTQVAFPDGRQVWVPQQYVTLRSAGF